MPVIANTFIVFIGIYFSYIKLLSMENLLRKLSQGMLETFRTSFQSFKDRIDQTAFTLFAALLLCQLAWSIIGIFILAGKQAQITEKDLCMECGACAAAVIIGWITGSEASCDCGIGECC